ncbi:mechanosensitive ion channel protein [Herbaspirillum rubrisubalbicans]|uniref:Mechanosensitive ion channel protein n=2 Tax=Herbaspirillum rubrisubalbicans TaxID=80842 RepID=A0ABX9C4L3_9BURK|nr:mechanosensitive ion channel domain-containing protein [Herbaspirillum rubrisubalbicans]MCP1576501.1 small-conductance mechanosensitive channel [Herbaspirillum rubrisubalbicans]QJP99732.1 mechanosensitive ion channel protein [Herbaspirillum rubrisubalbicans Os34]RAM65129.1 mechanosensitive ion channel protein [Herbaspirillum rubrisubalbicans]RAN48761.1 mechanosensitive ion channel protein [Herbaspirillum rubrisubalbicans]
MTDHFLSLFTDISTVDLLRQLVVIALSLLGGIALSRWLRARFVLPADGEEQSLVMQIGVKSFARVLSPLLALGLLTAAYTILKRGHHAVTLWEIMFPLVIAQVAMRFVFYVLRGIFVKDATVGALLHLSEKLIALLVWLCVLLWITGLWPDFVDYLDSTTLPLARHKVSLLTMLQGAASVLVTLIIALWIGTVLENRLMKFSGMHSSLRTVVARMMRALLILIAFLVSLSLVGIDLTVLSVFGGALGVGIGLGLQKIASSYVSGFVILLERSMVIGDMVAVDKFFGKVTQINTRYTILEGLDGIETVLPNELFVSNPVQNYSLTHRIVRLSTQLTILYQDDVETVLSIMEQAALGVQRVSQQTAPQALLIKIGADGLELELGFWITDPENGRLNVLSEVNRAIWAAFKRHGVQVAHPKRDIRIMDERSFRQSTAQENPDGPETQNSRTMPGN